MLASSWRYGSAFCVALLGTITCSDHRTNTPATRVELSGAGATFPYPLYRAWFSEYGALTGTRINYYSVGSAEGLRLLERSEIDFGATDRRPATSAQQDPNCHWIVIPMATGRIAIAYNLVGLRTDEPLRFDAALLASIFSGRVTKWNAPQIRLLNPSIQLPPTSITVIHRGAGSGTSRAFSEFLSSRTSWKTYAADDSIHDGWPTGLSAEGNEGVAGEVKVRDGAIGYVELTYAQQNRLHIASIRGADSVYVLASDTSRSYPIVATTWLVVRPDRVQPTKSPALLGFIRWALRHGGEGASKLGYTPSTMDTVAHYDSLLRAFEFAQCAPTAHGSRGQ